MLKKFLLLNIQFIKFLSYNLEIIRLKLARVVFQTKVQRFRNDLN